MDTHESFRYTPSYCHKRSIELAQKLLDSNHKELAGSFKSHLNSYRIQGTLYGALFCGSLVFLSWTRFKGIKTHKPGVFVVMAFGLFAGSLFGVSFGAKQAIFDIGRIAEDEELDNERAKIVNFCKKRLQA